jgi:hypothetical protein
VGPAKGNQVERYFEAIVSIQIWCGSVHLVAEFRKLPDKSRACSRDHPAAVRVRRSDDCLPFLACKNHSGLSLWNLFLFPPHVRGNRPATLILFPPPLVYVWKRGGEATRSALTCRISP